MARAPEELVPPEIVAGHTENGSEKIFCADPLNSGFLASSDLPQNSLNMMGRGIDFNYIPYAETWNFERAKTAIIDDSSEFSRGSKSKFQAERSINSGSKEVCVGGAILPLDLSCPEKVQRDFQLLAVSEQADPQEEVVIEADYNPFPWPKRITTRHVIGHQENKCIPFASNYTTLEILFAPDYRAGKVLPLVDLRGHRFDNNTYAANIGIGGRTIPMPDSRFCEMLGINAYYDYRQGCIGYYQQFSVGIEVLRKRWDFRANVYVPFGHKKHIHSCLFNNYDGDYFAFRKDIESVSYSFNSEIGYLLIASENFLLYAAAGPYFLARGKCCESTPGGEIRIRPQYQDYIALDLSWRHDGLFDTIWQAEVIFNLPLYQLTDRNQRPCGITDRQIYQPIERFEVMPLSKRSCWFSNF